MLTAELTFDWESESGIICLVAGFDKASLKRATRVKMDLWSRVAVAALTAALVLPAPPAPAQAAEGPDTVVEVRVEGNQALTPREVLSHVKTRAGATFSEELIRADEQALLKTRRFENVVATKAQTDKGVIVTFRVAERPLVESVTFQGGKVFTGKQLAQAVTLAAGDPIDRFQIDSGARAIEAKYRSKGHHAASVTVDPDALQQRRVVYRIVEGQQVFVRAVRFNGNNTLTARELRGAVKTRKRLWPFITGAMDDETVDRDVLDLKTHYRDKGFLDVQVDRELGFDGKKAVVTFLIEEGVRYRIRKAVFQGAAVFTEAELGGDLDLVPGAFYDALALRRDVQHVQDRYGEIGYIYAGVGTRIVYTETPGLIDLVYNIEEEGQFRVGRIEIRGNDLTRMNVIRRQVQFYPGQWYNTVAARQTEQRLKESELFDRAEITPFGEAPGVRNALVEVSEAKTAHFIIGAGVSSSAGLLGNISYTENNFDILAWPGSWRQVAQGRAFKGAGQVFSISAEPGTEFSRFKVAWREPYLFDKPYSLGTTAFLFTSGRETYDETRYGGILSLGRRYKNRWYGEVSTRAEAVEVSGLSHDAPPDVVKVEGTTPLLGVKALLAKDRTDSTWLPSKGDRIVMSYEHVFSDFNFDVVNGDYHVYRTIYVDPLDRKHILAGRLSAGYILGEAPVFERFYGGGLGSIRGFRTRGISPRQGPTHEVVGGQFLTFIGGEYSYPLVGEQLRGVVFLDTGTVESDASLGGYRASVGFGVRWHVPFMGSVPMSLDFGFPLVKDAQDDTQIFSFSMGWRF